MFDPVDRKEAIDRARSLVWATRLRWQAHCSAPLTIALVKTRYSGIVKTAATNRNIKNSRSERIDQRTNGVRAVIIHVGHCKVLPHRAISTAMPIIYARQLFGDEDDDEPTTATKSTTTIAADIMNTVTKASTASTPTSSAVTRKGDDDDDDTTTKSHASTERVVVAADSDSSSTSSSSKSKSLSTSSSSSRVTSQTSEPSTGAIDDANKVKQTCTDDNSTSQQCMDAGSAWVKTHPWVFAIIGE
jgi:hypothetical protein